jgi:16S rRNA A1518/A1519 N6-dimethyltransferase RsmA/KsgA/DIM1 with predicted DNA glycosylase/AP lyase activity
MRQVLVARGIRLTKSLGQSFLHDTNQLRRIVVAAELTKADKVLEIGPGLGPLTELLIEKAGEVLAIEKDARLVEVLEQRFKVGRTSGVSDPAEPAESGIGGAPALRLLHDDALDYVR